MELFILGAIFGFLLALAGGYDIVTGRRSLTHPRISPSDLRPGRVEYMNSSDHPSVKELQASLELERAKNSALTKIIDRYPRIEERQLIHAALLGALVGSRSSLKKSKIPLDQIDRYRMGWTLTAGKYVDKIMSPHPVWGVPRPGEEIEKPCADGAKT